MKIFVLILLLLFQSSFKLFSNDSLNIKYDTLIDIFNKRNESKDGFHFKNRFGLNIPSSIIHLIDKKKTRLIGKTTFHYSPIIDYDSLVKNDPNNIPQARIKRNSEGKSYIGGASNYFSIEQINVWDDNLEKWILIFRK